MGPCEPAHPTVGNRNTLTNTPHDALFKLSAFPSSLMKSQSVMSDRQIYFALYLYFLMFKGVSVDFGNFISLCASKKPVYVRVYLHWDLLLTCFSSVKQNKNISQRTTELYCLTFHSSFILASRQFIFYPSFNFFTQTCFVHLQSLVSNIFSSSFSFQFKTQVLDEEVQWLCQFHLHNTSLMRRKCIMAKKR